MIDNQQINLLFNSPALTPFWKVTEPLNQSNKVSNDRHFWIIILDGNKRYLSLQAQLLSSFDAKARLPFKMALDFKIRSIDYS